MDVNEVGKKISWLIDHLSSPSNHSLFRYFRTDGDVYFGIFFVEGSGETIEEAKKEKKEEVRESLFSRQWSSSDRHWRDGDGVSLLEAHCQTSARKRRIGVRKDWKVHFRHLSINHPFVSSDTISSSEMNTRGSQREESTSSSMLRR